MVKQRVLTESIVVGWHFQRDSFFFFLPLVKTIEQQLQRSAGTSQKVVLHKTSADDDHRGLTSVKRTLFIDMRARAFNSLIVYK